MAKQHLMSSLNVTKSAREAAGSDEAGLAELMANAEYLRHSSSIINEALKEGFDVLQLPNGDIVTTGTKTIVNTFTWDKSKGKLVRARGQSEKPHARRAAKAKSKETTD
ncbi:MAG: DUF2671 domain-containing protein [Alphaproteobacteria bacterium]